MIEIEKVKLKLFYVPFIDKIAEAWIVGHRVFFTFFPGTHFSSHAQRTLVNVDPTFYLAFFFKVLINLSYKTVLVFLKLSHRTCFFHSKPQHSSYQILTSCSYSSISRLHPLFQFLIAPGNKNLSVQKRVITIKEHLCTNKSNCIYTD